MRLNALACAMSNCTSNLLFHIDCLFNKPCDCFFLFSLFFLSFCHSPYNVFNFVTTLHFRVVGILYIYWGASLFFDEHLGYFFCLSSRQECKAAICCCCVCLSLYHRFSFSIFISIQPLSNSVCFCVSLS